MADDIEAILDLGILAGAGVAHLLRRNHQPPVEVAVDAPGASRSYDYSVPDRLAPVEAGETVLVEFGRQRQALGIVLGPSVDVTGIELKPLLARVHADGPLVPPLTLAFARWLSQEYLAPPAATLRSMLPPGMLERLELVAELIPGKQPDAAGEDAGHAGAAPEFGRGVGAQRSGSRAAAAPPDPEEESVLERLGNGPKPARDLEGADGRAATLRRLRSMASRGVVSLEWTLTAASAGPRYERWLTLTDEGREVAGALASSGSLPGAARLGPRQRALLAELASSESSADPTGAGPAGPGLAGAEAAGRHGSGTATGLVRRGLVASESK